MYSDGNKHALRILKSNKRVQTLRLVHSLHRHPINARKKNCKLYAAKSKQTRRTHEFSKPWNLRQLPNMFQQISGALCCCERGHHLLVLAKYLLA